MVQPYPVNFGGHDKLLNQSKLISQQTLKASCAANISIIDLKQTKKCQSWDCSKCSELWLLPYFILVYICAPSL